MDSSIYNATVISKILINPDMMIVQIKTTNRFSDPTSRQIQDSWFASVKLSLP